MSTDHRREWLKRRVTKLLGLKSEKYFENMMVSSEDLENKLASFLDDNFWQSNESLDRLFYVWKASFEYVVDEKIMVPELGTFKINSLY